MEVSYRMWPTGEGNGRPLQYSFLENPMNSMKRQNDRILKGELPGSVDVQYATGEVQTAIANSSRKQLGQSRNKAQLWMFLVMKVKSNAVKNSIA